MVDGQKLAESQSAMQGDDAVIDPFFHVVEKMPCCMLDELASLSFLPLLLFRTLLGEEQVDIEGIGITPDIIIEQDNAGLAAGRDNVLERAIQLLNDD